MKHVSIFIIACILSGAAALSQGLYVESHGSTGTKQTFSYMPGKFKEVDGDGNVTIVRLDKETVYRINPAKNTYTEMTFAEMKNLLSAGKSNLDAIMKKRLEALPPEKRKEMEERMAAFQHSMQSEANYDVSATGESKTISGYACSEYLVKRNGKDFETVWATKALGDVEGIHKDVEQISERMASAVGAKPSLLTWFKEIPGFPIETEAHGYTHTVTHVERRAVSASEFEVPSGYTREKVKGFEQMGN